MKAGKQQKKITAYLDPSAKVTKKTKKKHEVLKSSKTKTKNVLASIPASTQKNLNKKSTSARETVKKETLHSLARKIEHLALLKHQLQSGKMSLKKVKQIFQAASSGSKVRGGAQGVRRIREANNGSNQDANNVHPKARSQDGAGAQDVTTVTLDDNNNLCLQSTASPPQKVTSQQEASTSDNAPTDVNALVTIPETINPYVPSVDRICEDVGISLSTKEMVPILYRFGPDHLIGTEKIPMDVGNGKITHFDGWSIRKCPPGVNPYADVVDKKGQMRKPFNFSGRLATLPELHRALRKLIHESSMPTSINRKEAAALTPGKYGIVDLYSLKKPTYTKKFYQFSGFWCFIQDVSYSDKNKNTVTYTTFTVTKEKSENAKKSPKNTSKKGHFEINISINHLDACECAVSLLMQANGMKPLPLVNEKVTKSVDTKGKKKFRPSKEMITSEEEESDSGEEVSDMEEEEEGSDDDELEDLVSDVGDDDDDTSSEDESVAEESNPDEHVDDTSSEVEQEGLADQVEAMDVEDDDGETMNDNADAPAKRTRGQSMKKKKKTK